MFLLQLAIFLPIQTILHPKMLDSLITQSGFFSSWQLQRYGEEAIAEITVYANGASPYPQPEGGQSKSKFLIDTANLWERMQKNTHQYTRNEGKARKQLI